MGKKIRVGDVFELKTPKGLSYFQFTNSDKEFGYLIRVLPGIFQTQPSSFEQLSGSRELFYIFFPLGSAVNKGIVKLVANEVLPEWAKKIPIMRRPGGRSANGKVTNWWICNGDDEKLVDNLTDEQRRFSLKVIWNDTLLIERICAGWTPEKEV